jgi:regulator of sirC expression with transglutaminase-like and TPR domain
MTPASKIIAEKHRRAFAAELDKPDDELDLAMAALLIAAEDEAHLDVDVMDYRARLAELGQRARERVAAVAPGMGIEAFNRFMFEEEGFHGNEKDYYDPRNSYLNQVLDRRMGLPLTLSIVYMTVGHRAGLNVEGIGLPGHFIVRASEDGQLEQTLVDPFYGKTVTLDECQERLAQINEEPVRLDPADLHDFHPRVMIGRLLINLNDIYKNANLYRQTLAVVERMLIVTKFTAPWEIRERATLLAQLDRLPEAIAALQTYLTHRVHSSSLEQAREQLHALQRKQAMRN